MSFHCDLGAHFVPKDLYRFGGAEPWSDNLCIHWYARLLGKKAVVCCLQSRLYNFRQNLARIYIGLISS
jgi:hypothetical protein